MLHSITYSFRCLRQYIYIYIKDVSRDIKTIKTDILERLKTIWNYVSIPIMSDTSIINKINIYIYIYIQTEIKFKKHKLQSILLYQWSKIWINLTVYLIFVHVR